MKKIYLAPSTEIIRVEQTSFLLAASPEDLPGGIYGPDQGDDLDDPDNDYWEW